MSSISHSAQVDTLVAALGDADPVKRQRARVALEQFGSAATSSLATALRSPQGQVRWEAAKALARIADPAAAEALVQTLGDRDGDIRWVAGEALIALGRGALEPVLEGLVQKDNASHRFEGAHHVLKGVADPQTAATLAPVLAALNGEHPEVSTPVAAEHALSKLRRLIP